MKYTDIIKFGSLEYTAEFIKEALEKEMTSEQYLRQLCREA